MRFINFNTEDAQQVVEQLIEQDDVQHLPAAVVQQSEQCFVWRPNGRESCWECTIKHLGTAAAYATELRSYPQYFIRMIGELNHAYMECPESYLADRIRAVYKEALRSNVVPNLEPLLTLASQRFQEVLPS